MKKERLPKSEKYPQFVARFEPMRRARLEAASVLLGKSLNLIVNEAVEDYLNGLPTGTRRKVSQLAKAIASK